MMSDAYGDAPDEAEPRHEALKQLDGWNKEAQATVRQGLSGRVIGGSSDVPILIREELIQAHGDDIEALIDELQAEKSRLQADIDSDEVQEIGPSEAKARMALLDDAIAELEDALAL
jgi:hypothetical protein